MTTHHDKITPGRHWTSHTDDTEDCKWNFPLVLYIYYCDPALCCTGLTCPTLVDPFCVACEYISILRLWSTVYQPPPSVAPPTGPNLTIHSVRGFLWIAVGEMCRALFMSYCKQRAAPTPSMKGNRGGEKWIRATERRDLSWMTGFVPEVPFKPFSNTSKHLDVVFSA